MGLLLGQLAPDAITRECKTSRLRPAISFLPAPARQHLSKIPSPTPDVPARVQNLPGFMPFAGPALSDFRKVRCFRASSSTAQRVLSEIMKSGGDSSKKLRFPLSSVLDPGHDAGVLPVRWRSAASQPH